MPLVQSTTNAFQMVDRTNEIQLLPQTWTLLKDSGIFRNEYLSTNTVTFEERNGTLSIINDQVRGTKPQTRSGEVRKLHSYNTSHHPIMDALYPQDVAGKTRPGSNGQQLDNKDRKLMEKMERIRRSYDVTLEVARFKTLGTGQIWAPNGTVAADFYTDFGLTRKETDFVLGTAGTEIIEKCAEVIADFQSKATEGQIINRVIGYCGPTFFSKLIKHAKVSQTYIYQPVNQYNITQDRAGGMGLYRTLSFGGIDFIEVTTVLAGQALVVTGDCVFVAEDGGQSFVTYYSPANRFDYVNTLAESTYMWTYEDPRGTEITIEAEMNMLNVLRNPRLVSRGFSSN